MPIFDLIRRTGQIDNDEMDRVFNLGLGMLLVVSADQVEQTLSLIGKGAWAVGKITSHDGGPFVQIL
jgi:phosphoribosylformylglycinamidine cyclo-ligase